MSLIPFCLTEIETKYITEYEANANSIKHVAELFGKNRSTIRDCVKRVKNRAAIQGFSPEHDMKHLAPETHLVKGTSSLYGANGDLKLQWVKTNIKQEALIESLMAVVEGMKDDIPSVAPVVLETPEDDLLDLLNLYTISDAHIGMLAQFEEGGSEWNIEIAEETIVKTFTAMVEQSPNSKYCVINNLGDFLHSTGMSPVTPTHGHILDQDGRFFGLVRASIRIIRYLVYIALKKHEVVHIKMVEGNHDDSASVWLREMFDVLYENEPRVTVDTSPKPYSVYQFGEVMLGFHHGHIKKNAQLPLLFASEFSEMWGMTSFRVAHCGHRHSTEITEHSGMLVEQHSTIAARDAYASRGGWHSFRRANCITYHKEFGEVGRIYVSPAMIGDMNG